MELRDNVRCSSWAHWKARSGLSISVCHSRLVLLLTRWHSLVRHVTMWARATRRMAAVDVKTACCVHGIVLLPRCMYCRRGIVMRFLSVRPSVRPSVRLSVRLSVTRVNCDKTVERSVQIYIPYERTFILVLWEDRMVGGGRPLVPEILS